MSDLVFRMRSGAILQISLQRGLCTKSQRDVHLLVHWAGWVLAMVPINCSLEACSEAMSTHPEHHPLPKREEGSTAPIYIVSVFYCWGVRDIQSSFGL